MRFPEFCGKPCGKEKRDVQTSLNFSNLHCLHTLCCIRKFRLIKRLRDKHWSQPGSDYFGFENVNLGGFAHLPTLGLGDVNSY